MTAQLPYFEESVRPEWIDYNGHLSEAYYVLVFGHATDALMAETGLGPTYRERTNCSLYTVESHIRYLTEVDEGARLTVCTRVLGVDAKKLRFSHEMFAGLPTGTAPGPEAAPVATTELLALHVDQAAGGTAPFPEDVHERFAGLVEESPVWAGRSIGPVPRVG